MRQNIAAGRNRERPIWLVGLAGDWPARRLPDGLEWLALPWPEHRRVQNIGVTAPVQLGRPAAGRDRPAGVDEEPFCASHLAVEIPWVERGTPDDLVHPPQLGDGERVPAERRAERCVLELRP